MTLFFLTHTNLGTFSKACSLSINLASISQNGNELALLVYATAVLNTSVINFKALPKKMKKERILEMSMNRRNVKVM